ncbi:hypothetical protein DXG01_003762 [Tephrocybe rancida]|nr:hypothetical protein DXG01_003762 [Tephrocybe rancida]
MSSRNRDLGSELLAQLTYLGRGADFGFLGISDLSGSALTPSSTHARSSVHPDDRDEFPPIYAGRRAYETNDIGGFLPFNRHIRRTSQCILHWDNQKRKLVPFLWPVIEGRRATPDEWAELRQVLQFLFPCCLCTSQDLNSDAYTEAAVFMVTRGNLAGHYVAACRNGICKYFILLERFYDRRGLPLRSYPPRSAGADVPPPVDLLVGEGEVEDPFPNYPLPPALARRTAPVTPYRRPATPYPRPASSVTPEPTQRSAKNIDPFLLVPAVDPPARPRPESTFDSLMTLDSTTAPGLTLQEFSKLFVRCRACSLIMTRRVLEDHVCVVPSTPSDVIDLTGDD